MSPKAIFFGRASCSGVSSFVLFMFLAVVFYYCARASRKVVHRNGPWYKKTTGGLRRLFGCRFCRLLALESRWGISLGRFGFCFMALAEVLSAVPCVAGSVVGGVLLLWRRLCRRSCGFGQVPGRLLCLSAFPVAVVFVCSLLRYSRCERGGGVESPHLM